VTIAIVGTGVAGLGAAYALSRTGEVELFEASAIAGGHTRTTEHAGLPLDSGFIVHNEVNYPELHRLFGELGVTTQPSEMSFSVDCPCGVAWSSRRPWRAGPRLLSEILRFLRTADPAAANGATLDGFLRQEGYSESFRWHYLVPMTSAIWSTAPGGALEFPAAFGLEFFRRHGMLGLRRHRWRTVVGGSRAYVDAILARIDGPLHTGLPVRSIARGESFVTLVTDDGESRRFRGVVVATSAPQALALLEDSSPDERRLLAAFPTTCNETVLHSDRRFLPRRTGDRSSWNYQAAACGAAATRPTMTYSLNRLQRLESETEYCVTLNRSDEIDPEQVIAAFEDFHPQMTLGSVAAQADLPLLNGQRHTAFAGAWQGYGFHEDGLVSGLRAASALGAQSP
jgi:predicted NAD/FAD-binding protein